MTNPLQEMVDEVIENLERQPDFTFDGMQIVVDENHPISPYLTTVDLCVVEEWNRYETV